MAVMDADRREQVKALVWTVPKDVEVRLHMVPVGSCQSSVHQVML